LLNDKTVRCYDANSTLAPFTTPTQCRLRHVIYLIQLVYHDVKSIFNHDMFSMTTELRLTYKLLKASAR